MTTSATSNYGSTFTFNGSSIGSCMVIDFPEISTTKAVTTNHAGGGVAESIPSGLVSLGDITLSVIQSGNNLTTLQTAMTNKTVAAVVVASPEDTMTGTGYILSAKAEAADATAPDANKMTVVVAFTGALVIS